MSEIEKKVKQRAASLKKDELISLYVEDCKEPPKVQRSVLTRASTWFEIALNSKFLEGQKQELRFATTSTTTVELFLYWLFEGELACFSKGNDADAWEPEWEEQLIQVNLWIFADMHFVPKLQNAVMRRLQHLAAHVGSQLPLSTVRTAYENTPPGSPMRRFMIDQVAKGIFYGPGISPMEDGDEGYSVQEVAALSGVPSFIEDLLEKYHFEMISQCDPQAVNMDTRKYYVSEEKDRKLLL